jgi:hypothetical protein
MTKEEQAALSRRNPSFVNQTERNENVALVRMWKRREKEGKKRCERDIH